MKKHFTFAVLTAIASLFCMTSCHIDGTSYAADKADGYEEAIRLILKNVDTNDSKVYYMEYAGSEENGNKLETVTIKVVTKANMAYSQKILLTGNQQALEIEEIAQTFEAPVYADVKGIDFKTFTAQKIENEINEAKKQIPEGSTFKSISGYKFSEVVPAGNSNFNDEDEIGKQSTTFNMSFTMKHPNGAEGFAAVRCIVEDNGKVKLDM